MYDARSISGGRAAACLSATLLHGRESGGGGGGEVLLREISAWDVVSRDREGRWRRGDRGEGHIKSKMAG